MIPHSLNKLQIQIKKKFQTFHFKVTIVLKKKTIRQLEVFEKLKVLFLAQKILKYFIIGTKLVYYLYKHCVRVLGYKNQLYGSFDH